MAEADDILDALAQRPIARLPKWEQQNIRTEARRKLAELHHAELRDIEDAMARRRLASREHPLF